MAHSYRQIIIDGSPVGLRGLDTLFADLRAQGRVPQDEGLGAEIVEIMGKENYIPYGAREVFAASFVREYAAYLARGESGAVHRTGFGTWRGYPREQIPWSPMVNEDLCQGCGACLKLCRTGALGPTEDGKAHVVEPYACVVGCSSCAALCRSGAITFPARSLLDAYPYKLPHH
jgi:NAD-dependent dihydropyrimidine dehydrogenase PreA subunit